MHTFSSTVPAAGQGNSEFNDDYNRLVPGEPVQLVLSGDWSSTFELHIRVPEI